MWVIVCSVLQIVNSVRWEQTTKFLQHELLKLRVAEIKDNLSNGSRQRHLAKGELG